MNEFQPIRSTRTSRCIAAPVEKVYAALLDPHQLVRWQTPGDMTAKLHSFDPRVGGGYQMSLFYSETDDSVEGKSAEREDRYSARYTELLPGQRIRQVITFDTDNPLFAGEMLMSTSFAEVPDGTLVTIEFDQIPGGIRLEDNDLGTRMSLEKLAQFVELKP